MHKKTKIFISLFFIIALSLIFHTCFAKYVIEDTYTIAKLNIDRCKPTIELIDISSSNTNYPTYANQTHLITGHMKIVEKNIVQNHFSFNHLQISVGNTLVTPECKSFFIVSENDNEKIYEFSFTHTTHDGPLTIMIPAGIVEDKSGLVNEPVYLSTGIFIDNTPPVATFKEIPTFDGKTNGEITSNERIRSVSGWHLASNSTLLTKEFSHSISYLLPITDFAENSSELLIVTKKASNILLQYGTYDAHSHKTLVTGGNISSPKTISSHSICKSESIYMKLSGDLASSCLQGKCYVYTPWGSGYQPSPTSEWIDSTSKYNCFYFNKWFTQLGMIGLNKTKTTSSNTTSQISNEITKQCLYGISGIQFRLKNTSDFSIVYQAYVKDIGWLSCSYDGQENVYQHNRPISAFRMNLVSKTDRSYLINFWNRDTGSHVID